MIMIFKYYTADLMKVDGSELITPSITIKTWFFRNPVSAVDMMRNHLESSGLQDHRIFNLRRIK